MVAPLIRHAQSRNRSAGRGRLRPHGFRRRTPASAGGDGPGTTEAPAPEAVVLVNPLGAALHHYQAELVSVLAGPQVRIVCLETVEPHVSGRSPVRWLLSYLTLLASAGRRVRREPHARLICVWPVLGYLDLALLRLAAGSRAALVFHDPVPLVRSVGYGRAARWLGRTVGAGVGVILHSGAARKALDPRIPEGRVTVLPHPILPTGSEEPEPSGDAAGPTVRVLGQYKPDRDVDALRSLARALGPTGALQVHGRGWPDIPGWSVHSNFVAEPELESLLSSSDVVLVPYRRFFQSGIAIRCLEHGVPVVGPAHPSLQELYGQDSQLLVRDPADWARAVRHAVASGRAETMSARRAWRARCEQEWPGWTGR